MFASLNAFEELVDLLGGVEVFVPADVIQGRYPTTGN